MKKSFALVLFALGQAVAAPVIDGVWAANVTVDKVEIPFRIQFSGTGQSFKAWFFNGDEKIVSTSGTSTVTSILARFDQYNSRLEATLRGGALDGDYTRDGKVYPVHAVPFQAPVSPAGAVPDISGAWVIQTGNTTGERAWHC